MLPCHSTVKSLVLPYVPQNLQVRVVQLFDAEEQNRNATEILDNQIRASEQNPISGEKQAKLLINMHRQRVKNTETRVNLFFMSTCHLYSRIPLDKNKILGFSGLVMRDGLGDYYHIFSAAELAKSKFPQMKVSMIPFFQNPDVIPVVRKPDPSIQLFCLKDDGFSSEAFALLEKADLIIEMSQPNKSNDVFQGIIQKKSGQYRYIPEYGHIQPQAMGVEAGHLGIIIKDKPVAKSVIDIKNESLKAFLFKTQTPTESDLESYRSTHALFIGYLKKGSYYQTGLIYTLAAYLKDFPQCTIDILIPSVCLNVLDFEFLREQGIGKITSVKLGQENKVEEILLAETEKELRLINPFPLEQNDLHILFDLATDDVNPLVGCAGDQSFSEVVSFGRLPFFENHNWKNPFFGHLAELAGTVGKEPHYLKQYFTELRNMYDRFQESDIEKFQDHPDSAEKTDDWLQFIERVKYKQPHIAAASVKIAALMRHPELHEELQEFTQLLREHYSFAPVLHHIVEKQLAFNRYPELQLAEKEIEEKFLSNHISLAEGLEMLTEKIKTLAGNIF